MRRSFYLLLCSLLICTLNLQAQNSPIKVTEASTVKDSSGVVYPFIIWRALLMNSEYIIQPIDPQDQNTAFLLVKLSEEQKNKRLERMLKPRESTFFKTGKEFSLFKTSDIDHNKINLKEEKGKIIVLNFWFIDCPPCRMEIPALNELVEAYKGNDSVRFIAIALDVKPDLKYFLKSTPFNYTIVDDGRYLATRYGVRAFPTHVIIDQQGKIYFHTVGLAMNTAYWLKKSIDELLRQSSSIAQK
ncbi:MAG: TlpA family protein disulfide reductase [Williamsia sp.]|nr:TlpA family protein disulfide reductase [Williamsia sp.]